MQYISFNKGQRQVSDYATKLAQLPSGTLITEWHRGDDATRVLLDACAARGNRLLIQADDWPTQRSPAWVSNFVSTFGHHPAFDGLYMDEPGLKRQTVQQYANFITRVRAAGVRTVAVFGQFGELSSGFAGLADLEGVDNYWDDPTRPKPREQGWSEYTQFVNTLLAVHAGTNYAGDYVSVVTAYAAGNWHATADDMQRTREYLRERVGDRLTMTMLYASVIDGGHEHGYMDDAPTFSEVKRFIAMPTAPTEPETLTITLRRGQRLIVTAE